MKHFIYLFIIVVLCSCSSAYKIKFPKQVNSVLEIKKELNMAIPLEIIKHDNLLLCTDFRGDSLLKVYDIMHNAIIKNDIPYGEGPEESLSPIQIILEDSILYVHNRWHYSMKRYILDFATNNLKMKDIISRLSTDIDMIYPLNDSTFIASGRFSKGRYAIMDERGVIKYFWGTYPNYKPGGEETIPNFPRFMFHQSMFARNKNYLVSSTRHVLDIYDISSIFKIRLKKRILLSSYDYFYKTGDESAQVYIKEGTEKGVERICVTDKYIYLLYNSNARYEKLDNMKSIFILDWDGQPIKNIKINGNLTTFCVDKNDQILYGIANMPEPTMVQLKL